jgi:hypothetical protein
MSRAFISLALTLVVGAAGCGPRKLDLVLTIDAGACMLTVPAGGSILYQVLANGSAMGDGGPGSFCGACLTVDSAINGPDELVSFLRAHAPSCAGVHPDSTLGVRVTGWSTAGCPQQSNPGFCADAPSVLVPDGTHDATLMLALGCKAQCSAVCVPTTCIIQGKNCGMISDGCNQVLDCGTCHPPLRCGVNTANVCGR